MPSTPKTTGTTGTGDWGAPVVPVANRLVRRTLCNRGVPVPVVRGRTVPVPVKQRLLFTRPVKAKPEPEGKMLQGAPLPPKGERSWLRSFVSPEVWTAIEHPPQIVKGRRKAS